MPRANELSGVSDYQSVASGSNQQAMASSGRQRFSRWEAACAHARAHDLAELVAGGSRSFCVQLRRPLRVGWIRNCLNGEGGDAELMLSTRLTGLGNERGRATATVRLGTAGICASPRALAGAPPAQPLWTLPSAHSKMRSWTRLGLKRRRRKTWAAAKRRKGCVCKRCMSEETCMQRP